jgi:hypothetical protein
MTNKGKKLEPPLKLDMSFAEMMVRALQTDPKEVEASIERAKQKKPPGASGAKGIGTGEMAEGRKRKPSAKAKALD